LSKLVDRPMGEGYGGRMSMIRVATLQDAGAIARVHVESWQTTYAGIVPEAYLASLDVGQREASWREWLGFDVDVFVAEADGEVVGFVGGGAIREPVEMFGAEIRPLAGLLEACRSTGWRVLHLSVADQREWDDFESSFRAGRQEWLLAHAADPRAAEVRDWLDDRERQYLEVYRGVLGFAYLVLAQEEVIGLAPDHPDQTAPDQTAPDQTAPEQSEEDTDAGWGERPEPGDDERLYGERPPHWE